MSLVTVITASTIVPMILIVIFLNISKNENQGAIRIFSFLLFQVVFLTLKTLIFSSYEYLEYYPYANLASILVFCLAPTLYLYIKYFVDDIYKIKYLILYLPFLSCFSYYLYIYFFENKLYSQGITDFPYQLLLLVQNVFLIIASVAVCKYHCQSLRNFFFSYLNIRLIWVRILMFIVVIILALESTGFIIYELPTKLFNKKLFADIKIINQNSNTVYFAAVFVFFTIVLYMMLYRTKLVKKQQYTNSNIDEQTKQLYQEKLQDYMQEEKPYLNPELSLTELSQALNIRPKILSQIINELFNCNYYEFINNYRIDESKKMFEDENCSNCSILEILLDSGFNSKSTFNAVFKKSTGITPREYRAAVQLENKNQLKQEI